MTSFLTGPLTQTYFRKTVNTMKTYCRFVLVEQILFKNYHGLIIQGSQGDLNFGEVAKYISGSYLFLGLNWNDW